MKKVRQDSWRAWFLAVRPKTLPAALLPVAMASALAFSHGRFVAEAALCCVLFATFMQIAANYINDLYDFLRGTDREDRLGPERACAQGWISPRAMRRGIFATLLLAGLSGMALLVMAPSPLLLLGVGLLCVVFAFLYTTLLSYCGMGDVLVWVFFGIVPVAGTYYVQAGQLNAEVGWMAAGCGLVTDTLLVLNNYRDRDTDRLSGKRTLIVTLGEPFGRYFYLLQGLAGYVCVAVLAFYGHVWTALLPLLYVAAHCSTWRRMVSVFEGRGLNAILGLTSRNMLVFGLLVTISLLL